MPLNALRFCRDSSGNIAISAAICAPLIIYSLGMGIDYGMLTLQQRRLQQLSDIGAIAAAADINHAPEQLLANFKENGVDAAITTENGYLTGSGTLPKGSDLSQFQAVVSYMPGSYFADLSISPDQRFVAGKQPYDAVKVAVSQKGELAFANIFATAPTLSAAGTASAAKVAAFSVGSRLASVNDGVLNALLGALLGTSINLKAVDYESLASTDINLLSFLDLLATNINASAATYDELLATDISYPRLLNTLGKTPGLPATVDKTLSSLEKALGTTQIKVKLEDILNLGSTGERAIGSGSHLEVVASAMELISATALAANQKKQVAANVNSAIPGLLNVKLTLAVGERPVGYAANAVGTSGSAVRTPQIRLAIETSVPGIGIIGGMKLRVPLYVEVAYAEARLSSIACLGGGAKNVNVGVEAVPGVAEIALGDVDTSAFANFGSKPRVTKATLLDVLGLLKASAIADVNVTNLDKSRLTFQPSDIAAKAVKNVSTRDTLTSTVQSLLGNTDIDVQLLTLTLGTPKAVTAAVSQTLTGVTKPLDELVYNTLSMLGIKIGEADIRVTDARCQQSVLVQ